MRSITIVLLGCLFSYVVADHPVNAQDLFGFNRQLSPTADSPTKRHVLICCGLPGDDRHRELMTEACQRLIGASKQRLGVAETDLVVLAGDEEMQEALRPEHPEVGVTTRESLEETLKNTASTLTPSDGFWCFLIGHSHPYGAESQFNVLGKDINQSDFAQAAMPIECREQVFWLTQPISGFWIKPLSRPGRIVISATEADLEFTGTEMPYALAAVLSDESENVAFDDVDGDGVLSLLDLYLAANLEVTGRFRAIDRLQTEHAQLDDNGDGRGSEVQQPYLPAEPEEEEEEEEEDAEEDEADEDEEAEENDGEENDGEDGEEEAAEEAIDEAASPSAEPAPKPPLIQSQNLDGFRSRYVLILDRPESKEPEPDEDDPQSAETTAEDSSE